MVEVLAEGGGSALEASDLGRHDLQVGDKALVRGLEDVGDVLSIQIFDCEAHVPELLIHVGPQPIWLRWRKWYIDVACMKDLGHVVSI